ncbi:GyrI-like domain-containing protein [Micromonospora costi]|nr:GyrI-like domain-containing protein [Micromonospora costi]
MTTIDVREPQSVLSTRQTVPIADLTRAQGASLHELWRFLRERGLSPSGPPFVRYHTFGDVETDVEVGVPVGDAVTGAGRISSGELPGGRAITTVHLGAHDRLGDAYDRLQARLAMHGRAAGPGWEVYEWIDLTREPDPSSWPAPADWRTQLVQPIT